MISPADLKIMCRPHWDMFAAQNAVSRIWRRDHSVWRPEAREIRNRLGWLDAPDRMRPLISELEEFAQRIKEDGFSDVVILGMGGSSLCVEVFRQAFGSREGFPRMWVLDSTIPAAIQRVARETDPHRTLFLVSSKSGGTIEVVSLYKFFRQRANEALGSGAGRSFVAITDEGTDLARMAAEHGFQRTFINPSDVGGRYSALTFFGMVPAALMGINVRELLRRSAEMARACGISFPIEENPGAWLGSVMGCLARKGRDKLTLITSPTLTGFGLWVEQLVAESTGKQGKGIVPIVNEPLCPPEAFGTDRLFVYTRLATDDNAERDAYVETLRNAGNPVLRAEIKDTYALGGEFFLWEFATAVAGACLEINPFDQPNVQESKENSRQVLEQFKKSGAPAGTADDGDFAELLKSAGQGDYVALMAFADATPELDKALDELRRQLLLKRHLPTMVQYGPRFLHSTGQLYKGGGDNGLFVQFTCDAGGDLEVPGEGYGFAALAAAQEIGDFASLRAHKRRAIRLHAPDAAALLERVRGLSGVV